MGDGEKVGTAQGKPQPHWCTMRVQNGATVPSLRVMSQDVGRGAPAPSIRPLQADLRPPGAGANPAAQTIPQPGQSASGAVQGTGTQSSRERLS